MHSPIFMSNSRQKINATECFISYFLLGDTYQIEDSKNVSTKFRFLKKKKEWLTHILFYEFGF